MPEQQPGMQSQWNTPPGMPPPGSEQMGQGGYPPQGYAEEATPEEEVGGRIEELAEAIIDEKWKEITANISRVIDWKEKTEQRIIKIEADIEGLKGNFDKLHTSILEKVGEYDKHIMDVGTEVKALEKVFQKILPGFLENVNELSRITDNLKKVQK